MDLWLPEYGHVLFSLTMGTCCLAPAKSDRNMWLGLSIGYVITLVLYGVLVHTAAMRPMSASFICILAPYVYLFLPLSRFRDLRYLVTVLMIGNLCIVLQFFTNYLMYLLPGPATGVVIFVALALLSLGVGVFARPVFTRYLKLLQHLPRGWGLMTATSAVIEMALIYLSIYPAPLKERPEYFSVYAMFLLTVVAYYAVLISILFKMRRIYDQDRTIRHQEGWFNMAYMDALTGQPNRMAYMEKLAALQRDPAALENLGIVVLDINDLKQANDSHGHDEGDALIRDAAALLAITFTGDKAEVYRIGGDEFAVIDQAASEADLARKLNFLDVIYTQNKRFSMAAGYAMVRPSEPDPVKSAFRRADRLMYQDKARRKAQENP